MDFWFSCAYCTTGEIEATAISFEIDHYEPETWAPALVNQYDNLMWCCRVCNRRKSDDQPNAAQRAAGIRFFRPDWDHPEEHFEVVEVESLRARTEIGKFSIILLHLNRRQLKDLRRSRNSIHDSTLLILNGIRSLRGLGIDRFPPRIRLRVMEIKKQLEDDVKKSIEDLDVLLQQYNRARSIDPDPELRNRTKIRREYLKTLNSLFPD